MTGLLAKHVVLDHREPLGMGLFLDNLLHHRTVVSADCVLEVMDAVGEDPLHERLIRHQTAGSVRDGPGERVTDLIVEEREAIGERKQTEC